MEELSAILECYSLEEIIEHNDITEEEVLEFLLRHRFIELPEVLPL